VRKERVSTIGPQNPDFRVDWEQLESAEVCRYADTEGHLQVGTRRVAAWKGLITLENSEKRKIFLCNECRFSLGSPPNVKWTNLNAWIVPDADAAPTSAKKKKKKS
jgi:hypothetical protein